MRCEEMLVFCQLGIVCNFIKFRDRARKMKRLFSALCFDGLPPMLTFPKKKIGGHDFVKTELQVYLDRLCNS